MTEKPLVSVIVPTKDSEATIGKCLESIRGQTYPNVELIVVDNLSHDATREIAQKHGAKVYSKGPERSSQVNFGAKKAKGKYVYRVDSDFVLEPTVVQQAVLRCENGNFDAVAVHNTSDPTISFWSKVRKLERDCYRDDELNIGARFLRKDVFDRIGGFDESLLAGEDYDLHNRLLETGARVSRIKAQEVHIGEPRTLREIALKHYFYGKTLWNYVRKNPERARGQFSPIRLGYFRSGSAFLRNPSCAFGVVVYQFVRYSAAAIGFFLALQRGKTD